MIWNILLSWISGLITIVTALFPTADSTVITQIQDVTTPLRALLTTLNFIVPVNILLIALGIIFSTEAFMIGLRITMYLIHMLTVKFVPKL
jgi:hypothetical protein